jgi:hypothetical protein
MTWLSIEGRPARGVRKCQSTSFILFLFCIIFFVVCRSVGAPFCFSLNWGGGIEPRKWGAKCGLFAVTDQTDRVNSYGEPSYIVPFFFSLSFCCCCCCLHIQVCVCVCVPFLIKHSKCHPQGRQLIDVSVGERGRTVHSATNNCWSLLMTRAVAWHQSIITHTHSLRICNPF